MLLLLTEWGGAAKTSGFLKNSVVQTRKKGVLVSCGSNLMFDCNICFLCVAR